MQKHIYHFKEIVYSGLTTPQRHGFRLLEKLCLQYCNTFMEAFIVIEKKENHKSMHL